MIDLRTFNRSTTDFKRDYINSIIEIHPDNGDPPSLLFVSAIGFDGNVPVFHGNLMGRVIKDSMRPPKATVGGYEITFKEWFPEPMLYNTETLVLSLSYRPCRQYCRSFNRDIAIVGYPECFYSFGYPSGNIASFDNSAIKDVYNNIDISFEAGIAQMTQGERLAFRLFGYFYCMLHPTDTNHPIKIMCGDSYIGFVDGHTGQIRLFKGAVFLRDVFRDNGYSHRMAS
jgi:hypothetical protein